MSSLPLSDPQFWIVSLLTLAVVVFAVYRALRRDDEAAAACASCPAAQVVRQAPPPAPRVRPPALTLLCALLAGGFALEAQQAPAERVERRVAAMGTTLTVVVDGLGREEGLAVAERLIGEVAAAEARLSTWREDSELAALNRTPVGQALALSQETWKALSDAVRCAFESDGAFDPTVGSLVAAWGLRGDGRVPDPEALAAARAAVDWRQLQLDAPARTAARLGDFRLEEGGFGKGAALAGALALARQLAPHAEVRLDLGGQLAWTGARAPVAFSLADPRNRGREVLEVVSPLGEGSVATSGESERRFEVGGRRFGHLLDPRTGEPAADFGTASSIGPSPTLADCRSTALFVLGPDGARAKIAGAASQGDNVLLVVEGDRLRALVGPRLLDSVKALTEDVSIEVVPRSR
ncbi:MAG: FAD:protein FMN transferase [Thermoanaerobaculia bacterium]|nr:FAD:protein FMN transferase [Thermoanaerobaculia bacterium]